MSNKWKKTIKTVVISITFFLMLFLFSALLNRDNTGMTMEMTEATYPTVSIQNNARLINRMQGYAKPMDTSYMRESITPLEEGRSLSIYIEKYGQEITGLAYEVRSIDGERLIESTDLTNYVEKKDYITTSFSLKDLIETNQEYTLVILVSMDSGEVIRYYTRIIQAYDYKATEKLAFAFNFSNKTFADSPENEELITYLESDATGDNTNYRHVNIHSSFDQITWGDLEVVKETEPVAVIEELASSTATIRLEYMVSLEEGRDTHFYNVTERFRVRLGAERMYLLEYDRYMDQMFFEKDHAFYGNKIVLGITDENISLTESEDGNVFAFIKEGNLYVCNITENKVARAFSFYDEDNFDWRTRNQKHDIKILSVDETGNAVFMVYGYMNRGKHEGEVGIQVYAYDGLMNTVEEVLFIPYDKTYEMLKVNVEKLAYLNQKGDFYVYLEGTIFCVDVETGEYQELVSGVSEHTFKVSENNTMLVWQAGNNTYNSREMLLMSLEGGKRSLIKVEENERVLPLGFMGNDLIYGIANLEDIYTDSTGSTTFPMHTVYIRNQKGDILKTYGEADRYVTGCEIQDNMITLQQVKRDRDGIGFTDTAAGTILNNEVVEDGKNSIEVVATENYKKIVQIVMRSEMDDNAIKFMAPQEVLYEGERDIVFDIPPQENVYYVYSAGVISGVYTNPGAAIREAYAVSGSVLNAAGDYVWIKGNLVSRNQIMKITGTKADDETSSLAVCLETILSFEGFSRDAQELLNKGYSAVEILEEAMPGTEILELQGCTLDSVLYYVNQDIPVLFIGDDGEAVLIVGFNDLNTVWMNPENGRVYKVGMNDSKEFFEENGNNFIAYLRTSD
ncbi:MAG: hypothetical protein IJ397_03415 [Lachnospiraceae bacterium]|nr:hypothetical protein [Lachnospiraceae bacterium]